MPEDSRFRALQEFVSRLAPGPSKLTAELETAAAEVLRAFAGQDIDALLLKGPALARALYVDGESRDYSDIDVLVRPVDLPRARAALEQLGYRNASAALGIEDVGGVVHEESWIGKPTWAGQELVIELHKKLPGTGRPAELVWDALQSRTSQMELHGAQVRVLNREASAMQLATHAAQHGPRYERGCRELELAIERWPFEVWERAAALAEEVDAVDRFAGGLRLVPSGTALAGTLGLRANDRLDWEISQVARPRGTFHLEALRNASDLRSRAGVLRRAIFPSRRWIAWQYPWARDRRGRLLAAYGLHLLRAPLWAIRALWFHRRARRAERRTPA